MNNIPPAILLICLAFAGCSGYKKFISNYSFRSADGRPDYSNLDYWAAHPYKKDPSDSLPAPLIEGYKPDSSVDVFFVYPTSYGDISSSSPYNAAIDDSKVNAKTDYRSILYQASIFNAAGRVFAPRYRQANFKAYFYKDSLASDSAFHLAYEDVKAAFKYYMAHYNNGRPIIIAAHSQGTTHAMMLLKEFFDGKPLKGKLVAAYLVGMPIPPGYFTHFKACESPDETGCFCGWRTMKKGYMTPFAEKEKYTAIVTNPLTWKAIETDAPKSSNPGSVFRKFNKVKPHAASAQVHGGVLWSIKPRFFGNIFLITKNYHVGDYNFYYLSIRQNAKQRVEAYLNSK